MNFGNKVYVRSVEEGVSLEFAYQPETGLPEFVASVEIPERTARELEGLLRMRRQVPRDPDTR